MACTHVSGQCCLVTNSASATLETREITSIQHVHTITAQMLSYMYVREWMHMAASFLQLKFEFSEFHFSDKQKIVCRIDIKTINANVKFLPSLN